MYARLQEAVQQGEKGPLVGLSVQVASNSFSGKWIRGQNSTSLPTMDLNKHGQ